MTNATDSNRRDNRMVYGLLALGLVLRLIYARHVSLHPTIPTSVDTYEDLAISLLATGEYAWQGRPTSLREPVFPLFIAAIYWITRGPHPLAVIFIQTLLSLASAWLIFRLGRKLFNDRVAVLALAVCVVYPQFIYYSAYFFRETVMLFLFTLLAYLSSFWDEPGDGNNQYLVALAGGTAGSALALTNSAMLPVSILVGIIIFFAASHRTRILRAALYFLPIAAGFGIWTARNYSIQHRFIPGSTHGGEEFYQALIVPPEDLGTPQQGEILAKDSLWMTSNSLPEAERNSVLIAGGVNFIKDHPGVFLSRAAAGIAKFWRPWPYRRNFNHPYWILVLLSTLSDGWIVPLGLIGLWIFRRSWLKAPAFWVGPLMTTAVFGSIHAVIRYRVPLMGCMILFAVAVFDRFYSAFLSRS